MYIKSLGSDDKEAMTIIKIKTEHLQMDSANPGFAVFYKLLKSTCHSLKRSEFTLFLKHLHKSSYPVDLYQLRIVQEDTSCSSKEQQLVEFKLYSSHQVCLLFYFSSFMVF